jgi:hypothetical protein
MEGMPSIVDWATVAVGDSRRIFKCSKGGELWLSKT